MCSSAKLPTVAPTHLRPDSDASHNKKKKKKRDHSQSPPRLHRLRYFLAQPKQTLIKGKSVFHRHSLDRLRRKETLSLQKSMLNCQAAADEDVRAATSDLTQKSKKHGRSARSRCTKQDSSLRRVLSLTCTINCFNNCTNCFAKLEIQRP